METTQKQTSKEESKGKLKTTLETPHRKRKGKTDRTVETEMNENVEDKKTIREERHLEIEEIMDNNPNMMATISSLYSARSARRKDMTVFSTAQVSLSSSHEEQISKVFPKKYATNASLWLHQTVTTSS